MKDQPYNKPLKRAEGEAFKKGGATLKQDYKKLSGSETHGTLARDPASRKAGATAKQMKDGLPARENGTDPLRKRRASGGKCDGMAKGGSGNWMSDALGKPSSKGALHAQLGIPLGKKIPAKTLVKAEHSRNPALKKRAVLAHTLSTLRRGR